jgi:hypothetical protein
MKTRENEDHFRRDNDARLRYAAGTDFLHFV